MKNMLTNRLAIDWRSDMCSVSVTVKLGARLLLLAPISFRSSI